MSMQTFTQVNLNKLQHQSKTAFKLSPDSARNLYKYLRDELAYQAQPPQGTCARLVTDDYAVTFTPRYGKCEAKSDDKLLSDLPTKLPTSVHVLFRRT